MESDLCCVCGLNVKQKEQRCIVLGQSTNIISYIHERIAPQIVSENDYICQLCYKNIEQTSKESKATEAKKTNVGLDMEVFEEHTEQSFNSKCSKTAAGNVCLMCNTHLSTRKKLLIKKHDPTELDLIMLNLITEAISPETKIGSEDKLCSKCWCKVRRCAMHLQEMNKLEPDESRSEDLSMEIKSEPGSDQEHSELLMQKEEIGQQDSEGSENVDGDSQIGEIKNNSDTKPVNLLPVTTCKVQKNNGYEYVCDQECCENLIKNEEIGEEDSELIEIRSEDVVVVDDSQIDKRNENLNSKSVSDKEQKNNSIEYLSDLDPQINEIEDDPEDPDFIVKSTVNKNSAKQKKRIKDDTEIESLISDEIVLPSYKRAGSSHRRCLFPKCKNQEIKKISKEMRTKLIKDYKFYIPPPAMMCTEHFFSNNGNIIQESNWSHLKFNADHIEHMFSMVEEKKGKDIDFSDVLKLDDRIIKYVLGTTRDILSSILTREPKILSMNHGVKGLLAFFIKHENGSTHSKISDFLKISSKTLLRTMRNVKKTLSKSPVIKELGLEHILLGDKINDHQ